MSLPDKFLELLAGEERRYVANALFLGILCEGRMVVRLTWLRDRGRLLCLGHRFHWLRMNPNGGSVALGHPFGTTGARILSKTVKELSSRRVGQRAIVS